MQEFKVDSITVFIARLRDEMGRAAAEQGLAAMQRMLAEKDIINAMFAAAPSQMEVMKWLRAAPSFPWDRVNAFHMDNYLGLSDAAPQQFSNYLRDHLFSHLPFRCVQYMGGGEEDAGRYADLLKTHPLDVNFMGIGENGHIAFNEPDKADFEDRAIVKAVELDEVCRNQQVNDGCFASIELVPKRAITVTVPALMSAKEIFCTVPSRNKATAVRQMLTGEISNKCPASILRRHPSARLFLDAESASLL